MSSEQEYQRQYQKQWRQQHPKYHKEYWQLWYQKNRERNLAYKREYNRKHPHHNKTRKKKHWDAHNYIERNKSIRQSYCELCDSIEQLCAHHLDYDYPNIVVTVCKACHTWIHNKREDLLDN